MLKERERMKNFRPLDFKWLRLQKINGSGFFVEWLYFFFFEI